MLRDRIKCVWQRRVLKATQGVGKDCKRGLGWWVGWICVPSWPSKQINVISSTVPVLATGWQHALMNSREEGLLYYSVVRLHSRVGLGRARQGWRKDVRKLKKELCCSLLGRVWPFFTLHKCWQLLSPHYQWYVQNLKKGRCSLTMSGSTESKGIIMLFQDLARSLSPGNTILSEWLVMFVLTIDRWYLTTVINFTSFKQCASFLST